jgi:hypothetical protein
MLLGRTMWVNVSGGIGWKHEIDLPPITFDQITAHRRTDRFPTRLFSISLNSSYLAE